MQLNNSLMASAPRFKKRVFLIRRAPDGSAFHKCGACGVSIAIALADMHYCETKIEVKRFKGIDFMRTFPRNNQDFIMNQPISPYRIFMEGFMEVHHHAMNNYIEIDRMGFEKWKSMTEEEREPYVSHARALDLRHQEALKKEANEIVKVLDGAESKMVEKVDKPQLILIESSEDTKQ